MLGSHPGGLGMAVRVIKKYPNRRLYDTEISSYITIEDVRQLVVEGEEFQVRDARTGDDLTRCVMLQIIAEHEQDGEPVLSTQLLSQIIRFYGDSLQRSEGRRAGKGCVCTCRSRGSPYQ